MDTSLLRTEIVHTTDALVSHADVPRASTRVPTHPVRGGGTTRDCDKALGVGAGERERGSLLYFPAIIPFPRSSAVYFRDVPPIAKSLAQATSMVV